jgi:ribosomal protein S18 acetylase RimI-like enzyme
VLRQRPADEVNDLLVWSDGTLVGFCGIYAFGGDAELAGAVHPAHRRRGIGRELLRRAGEHLRDRGRTSALLVTPRASDAGREFALAMGATLDHTEHHLELDGPPAGPRAPRPSTRGLVVRPAASGDESVIRRLLEAAFGGDAAEAGETGPRDLALVVEREGEVVGTLRVDLGDETAGVYGFAVRPDLRGQGIGRAALYEVCLDLRRRGAQTVTLEVAVDNDHALGLYTSVGFERRTTEDYFAVAVV